MTIAQLSALCTLLALTTVFFAATTFFALVDPAGSVKVRRWIAMLRGKRA